MKKKFTFLMAALMLLAMFASPLMVLGETTTLVSGSGTSGYAIPDGWTTTGTVEGGTYLKFDNGTMTSPEFAPHNGLSFTYSVATFGSGTDHPLTIRILNASTNAVIKEETTATPTSSTYISTDSPISLGDIDVAFKIQMYAPTGKGIRLRNYSVTGTPAQQLTPSNLALDDAPVALTFDLYDNNSAQTISYTTSGTGTVSVVDNGYVTAEVDQENKTISVTPVAVTGTARTITVRQLADATYAVGTVTFTVNITDSTPFTGGDVTFDATTDTGESSLVKNGVTFACSSGALNNGSEYRLYKNSVTTFSVSEGTITKIVFTGVSGNPASGFASQTGWTTNGNNGTWTGSATSVSFTASGAQVRATQIVVTVTPNYTITAQSNNTAYGTVSLSGSIITGSPKTNCRYASPAYAVTFGTATVSQSGNDFTVTPSSDCTVQINFEEIPSHTLSSAVSPTGAGTVALGATSVLEGATTIATATANSGYKFTGWSISGTGASCNTSNNPTTVTIGTADATVTANFEAVTTYAINWSVNGTIVKTENIEENTDITFAAPTSGIPAGYTFKGWVVAANRIDGITTTEPSANYVTSGTSTADITYYAVMAIENGTTDRTATLTANSSWSGYTDKIFTDNEGNTWTAHCSGSNVSGVYYYGLNTPTNTNYFKSPNFGGNITAINVIATNGSGKDDRYYYISSDNTGSGDYGSITVPKSSTGKSFDAVLGGTSFTEFYLGVSGALQFHEISVVYAKTNYTSFCTTVLPISGHENISDGKLTTSNVTISSGAYYLDETITIEENKVLTVGSTGAIANNTAANLIIEDGGQLITNNAVAATLQKGITGYGNNTAVTTGWYTIASPVVGTDMSSYATGTYDLFKYDEANHLWKNIKNNGSEFTSTSVAEGFLYANGADQALAFAGTMKASNAEVTKGLTCSSTDKLIGFNLVGNPFTCNLTSSMVKMNGAALTTYYVSEGNANLKVRTLSSTPIKPGQGFFVQAPEACNLVFNPSSKDEMDYKPTFLSIEAGNNEFTDMAYIQLGYGNTLRKMSINDNTPLVYVLNDGADYAAAKIDELKGSMPVCFKAAATGQYTISVNTEGMDMNYLHLIDRLTGEDVNLLLEPTYSFIATKGDNESRFILSFTANCFNDSECETFAYQAGDDIFVSGQGELQIFDVTGRLVSTTNVNGVETINVPSSGMYIFRLVGTEVKTQKIVVR